MKKVLLFIFTFFMLTLNSYAVIDNECINSGQCLVLCNYQTTLSFGGNKAYRDLTIYYNYQDKDITIRWQDTDNDGKIQVFSKKGAIDYVFSNSGTHIYWGIQEAPTLSNFSCPMNGYLDTSDLNSDNELCFDNDGTTCKQNYSNIGTAFAHHGNFVEEKRDYDVFDQISKYNEWIFGDIKEEISKGTFNVATELEEKINRDFGANFLYNNDIPEFIANSKEYQNVMANVLAEFNKAKEEELKKSEEEVAAGTKTEEEHEQTKENWNVDPKVIESQAQMAFSKLNMKVTWLSDFDVSSYCDSYLGNPDIPGEPAYYLQFAFNIIKYAAIILLIVLTIVEFLKVVASSNQDAIKKMLPITIKRIILVFIIFMLPLLIKFLLTILGAYSPGTCGIS